MMVAPVRPVPEALVSCALDGKQDQECTVRSANEAEPEPSPACGLSLRPKQHCDGNAKDVAGKPYAEQPRPEPGVARIGTRASG